MRVLQMCKGLAGKDTAGKKLALNLILAFLPAAMLGPILDDRIEAALNGYLPVSGALFVGGATIVCAQEAARRARRRGGTAPARAH
jgi:undecaprenyl-diphosphatase